MFRSIAYLLIGFVFAVSFSACDTTEPQQDPVPLPELRVVADSAYTVTSSGLKYFDFVEGSGAAADSGNAVSVHYSGWFTNGHLFDSFLLRGQPFRFILGRGMVIRGWDEGVKGMKVGGQRQLFIPPDLAYGQQGTSGIPPNTPLIFEVEVIEF